ncbi:MAG: hypothetical protein IKS23_00870 [Alphaproteobacteria bacterium]|nr:hypothetical protein [Alphaproteobacteria bacterium]
MVEIFGKKYPSDQGGNSTKFSDWLPDFFEEQKSFSSREYYQEVLTKHPEYKRKWYEVLPSEKDIQKYFIKTLRYAAMDGATSVPKAEKKLGFKIGGGYKYPNGMSDIEYHAYTTKELGFYSPFKKDHKLNKKEAYMEAWQNLHYDNQKVLNILQKQYKELVEINPELSKIKLDLNNPIQLTELRAGVQYDFPIEDIQLFLNGGTAKTEKERVKRECMENGLNYGDFGWVLSSETIANISKKMKEHKLEIKNEVIQTTEKISHFQITETALSNDDKLAALSGRPAPSAKHNATEKKAPVAPKVKGKPSLKNMFQKVIDSVKSKFAKPKEKTAEEKAKDKKAYKIIQNLRGVLRPKKSRKVVEEKVQTNEQTPLKQVIEQRDVGR